MGSFAPPIRRAGAAARAQAPPARAAHAPARPGLGADKGMRDGEVPASAPPVALWAPPSPTVISRAATDARAPAGVPRSVRAVLASPGAPLDREARAAFEPRFGGLLARSVPLWAPAVPRAAGGRAVSSPTDPHERQAGEMSDAVAQMPSPAADGPRHDFGHVRVHTGPLAAAAARAVHASAFTVGNHIVMGGGVSTGSPRGRRLLAHELGHVVQWVPGARPVLSRQAATPGDDPDAKVSLGLLDNPVVGEVVEVAVGSAGWTVMRELLRGIRGGLLSVSPAQRARIQAKLDSMGVRDALHYAEGYGLGILEGLWDGLKSLGEALLTLVKLPYDLLTFLGRFPALAAKYGPRIAQFLTEGDGIGARIRRILTEIIKHPVDTARAFNALLEDLKGMALAKVRALGHGIAGKVVQLLEEPWFEYGEDVGKVVGRILFEVLLAIASDAIANVAKEALNIAGRLAARVVEGAAELLRTIRGLLTSAGEALGKLVARMGGELGGAFRELEAFISRLGALLGDLAGERALADTGTGIRVPVPATKGPTVLESRGLKGPGGGTRPKVEDLKSPKTHPSNVERDPLPPRQVNIGPKFIQDALASAAEGRGTRQQSAALRKLQRRLGDPQSLGLFRSVPLTEEAAQGLVRSILSNATTQRFGRLVSSGFAGERGVAIFEASGRGVLLRMEGAQFITFLEEGRGLGNIFR